MGRKMNVSADFWAIKYPQVIFLSKNPLWSRNRMPDDVHIQIPGFHKLGFFLNKNTWFHNIHILIVRAGNAWDPKGYFPVPSPLILISDIAFFSIFAPFF